MKWNAECNLEKNIPLKAQEMIKWTILVRNELPAQKFITFDFFSATHLLKHVMWLFFFPTLRQKPVAIGTLSHLCVLHTCLGHPKAKTLMYWSESNRRSPTWLGLGAHHVEVVTVRTGFILEDRGCLTAAFNYLMQGCGEYIARPFWDVHSDRWKAQLQFRKREILILY